MRDRPFVVACLVGALLAALVGISSWIALGVLATRDAAMKPPIMSCGSITPHIEPGR